MYYNSFGYSLDCCDVDMYRNISATYMKICLKFNFQNIHGIVTTIVLVELFYYWCVIAKFIKDLWNASNYD